MSDKLVQLVDTLSELSVLEMSELKKLLEDKWGVEASAGAIAVAGAPAAAAAVEESTEFDVTLEEVPSDKKISAIKAVREVTGLGLKEAKELVEGAPKVVKEKAGKSEAEEIKSKLEAAGTKASIKGV